MIFISMILIQKQENLNDKKISLNKFFLFLYQTIIKINGFSSFAFHINVILIRKSNIYIQYLIYLIIFISMFLYFFLFSTFFQPFFNNFFFFNTNKTAIFTLIPPPTDDLYEAFNEKFNRSGLTHGGRALSKHSIRDSSNFWGYSQGKVGDVNSKALKKVNQIVENSVWHNVIYLVEESFAYEIRNALGYGARWEFKPNDKIFFRGFLEPPMENGHELKWRH